MKPGIIAVDWFCVNKKCVQILTIYCVHNLSLNLMQNFFRIKGKSVISIRNKKFRLCQHAFNLLQVFAQRSCESYFVQSSFVIDASNTKE